MPISLANAAIAMTTLRGSSGADLFSAMQKSNGYLFSKHQNKAKALESAKNDRETKGYFKKIVTKSVNSLAEYKELSTRQLSHVTGLKVDKPQAKHFGQGKDITTTQTEALSSNDFAQLLNQILLHAQVDGHYRAANEPNERFLYITKIPNGYVGRSVDQVGTKAKDPNHAVIIVVAKPGNKPFILNMFPATDSYLQRQVALV